MITPNIQLPITVICFLAIIFFQFFNAEKISLLSTRVFSVMLVFSCINLLFDCITVLTVEHYEVVPWLVRLSHQIYLGALNTILFIFYLYIEVIGDRGARLYRKKSYFVLIFYIGSMIALIGAPLYFVEETYFSYSYGMMKNIIYLVASIYMLFIISTVIYYRKSIMRSRRSAIYIGCVIWFAVAVVQYMLPRLQITALFISLMIFFLYLTFENPAQYVNLELNCFNKHSFQLMLEESFRGTNDFYVVTKVFEDASFVYGKGLLEGESGILYQTVQELKLALTANVYRSKGNAFSVIIDSSKMSIDECRQRLDLKQNGITKLHINILQCPKYANSVDEVFDMVKLASEQKVAAESSQIPVIILDESFLDMRSRKKIIESLLREAMETDGFEVFYQPIFSIDHAGFVSSEALVRLKDTSSIGYISPEEFIPIAEKNGLILEL
ncbi:MAG: c-di-GMP phosphodiesterase, partial [Clostridiales bacterium]|nr:c-di-GMP phosphodiesterase [Clostridiales bacterium]